MPLIFLGQEISGDERLYFSSVSRAIEKISALFVGKLYSH